MADNPPGQNALEIPPDLKPVPETSFNWEDGHRLQSLQSLRDAVAGKIDVTAGWYMKGKRWRRKFGRAARVSAMILATMAAAQPTLAEMFRTPEGWWTRPGLATIFALLAAALLLLDRFFGASTGWVRYIMTGMALNDLRDEFEAIWRLESAAWAGQPEPNIEQTKHAISLLQGFITRVNEIVRAETEAWKAEFQSALQQVEDYAKSAVRKIEQSGLKVNIANFDKVEVPWSIALNGGTPEPVSSAEKTFTLTPGHTQIAVEATLIGPPKKVVRREELVSLNAGDVQTVSLTLA